MLDFRIKRDPESNEDVIETSVCGKPLLTAPQLNKGTAFTFEERRDFNLIGKLPIQVETLEEQSIRAYQQYLAYSSDLQKNIYLNNLHDKNQVLFYHLVSKHLSEMLPSIYTPIVGKAVKKFSLEFRQPRGLYIAYPERAYIDEILDNRSNPDISLIVVSDGEGVLGIGDQGVGGMDIPVAKLMVYTLCGGVNPNHTLPILLDVGTNNQVLLDDPYYLGWRHERVRGEEYDNFVRDFVEAVNRKFPGVFLHWEDFSRDNSRRNLHRFRNDICTFNDDMQGTGAVTVSALLAAVNAKKSKLAEERIVVFGAGTAGTGISDQIIDAMRLQGIDEQAAQNCFWLIDREGLLLDEHDLTIGQQPYARKASEVKSWECDDETIISLADVVKHVKPTILIGCSAVPGVFTEAIIKNMAAETKRPIIFPLSNPTECAEATPADLMGWTEGRAMIATGSPFEPVEFNGEMVDIAQCNNALVFPGIGLGVMAVEARRLTDKMIWAACQALSKCSPIRRDPHAQLLPSLDIAQEVARSIAIAVGQQAREDGMAQVDSKADIEALVDSMMWKAQYTPYKRLKS